MHLIRPGFTYSTCGPCTKNKETIQKFKEIGDSKYIYRNELDKARFQHDMAYGNFRYLLRRTPSDKVSREKAFNIARNPKYDGYQRGLALMVYKCFDKNSDLLTDKSTASGTDNVSIFTDNVSGVEVADVELISKCNKRIGFY